MRWTKKLLVALGCILLTLLCVSAVQAEVPEAYQRSTLQRRVYLPDGKGPFQYYAQNDPIWRKTIYEVRRPESIRLFGDGGCNPTSLAMVVASLVPTERLNLISASTAAGRDFALCSCSVNGFNCQKHYKDRNHDVGKPKSGEDFRAVLPLVFGDFATGNNPEKTIYRVPLSKNSGGGTSSDMFLPIAELYGLRYRPTQQLTDVLMTLDRGGMAIALCSGNSQIFSGSKGHYIVIAGHDDDYIYILDPYVRDVYKKDRRNYIESLGDGIKRVRIENIEHTGITSYSLFEAPADDFYASLPEEPEDAAPVIAAARAEEKSRSAAAAFVRVFRCTDS